MDYSFNSLCQMMDSMNKDGGMQPKTMMETFLPYLPEDHRQQMHSMMRVMELHQTIIEIQQNYSGQECQIRICEALRPSCTPKVQKIMDLILKLNEVAKLADEIFFGDADYCGTPYENMNERSFVV
jgi:hypothetical protein